MNKRFKGFTLMEMMVVMLIVTVILAASAPLMTKKKTLDTNQSPWLWANNSEDTYFGTDNEQTAIIGDNNDNNLKTRLFIKINNSYNDNHKSHIVLMDGNGSVLLRKNVNSLLFNSLSEYNGTSSSNNTAFGVGSLDGGVNGNNLGSNNTAFGFQALYSLNSGNDSTKSINNTAIGSLALRATTTGYNNVAVGAETLYTNTTGYDNVGVGKGTLFANTTGYNNVAVGSFALSTNATGNDNVAIGKDALKLNTSSNNVAVGNQALQSNTAGNLNIAVGSALHSNTTGVSNIGVGSGALYANTISSYNIGIGEYALKQSNTHGNIAIGTEALTSNASNGSVAIGTGALSVSDIPHSKAYSVSNNYFTAIGDAACQLNAGDKSNSNVVCLGHNSGNSKVPYSDGAKNAAYYAQNSVYIGNADSAHFYFGDLYIHKQNLSKLFASIYSDARLKNISGKNEDGLEKIKQLEVFNFTFKNDKDKTPHVGVIAQQLQKIFPDAVTKGDDGYLTIRKEDMFYAMVNAIKELDNKIQAIINELKVEVQRITKIESEIKTLQKENKELKHKYKELEERINKIEKAIPKN